MRLGLRSRRGDEERGLTVCCKRVPESQADKVQNKGTILGNHVFLDLKFLQVEPYCYGSIPSGVTKK